MATEVTGANQAPVTGTLLASSAYLINEAAKNVPFFTPIQDPPAGTPWDAQPAHSLFSPLSLRGGAVTLHNRIMLSPMCQYSAADGHMTPWHAQHLGSIAARGPGLVMSEAVAVLPEGRISPEDVGIWSDAHADSMRQVVQFAHSQGAKIGIQLAHAGRKASTVAPWVNRKAVAPSAAHGWPDKVLSASASAFSKDTVVPRAMTLDDIADFKEAWVAAVKRAVDVGFDVIEIHAAHGYLFNSFLSPASNTRTDLYGGSFENRVRLLVEIAELTRATLPASFPLFARIPGTDYLEHDPTLAQWRIDEACQLARILASKGVDLLDVSAGGLDARQKIDAVPGYQVPLAAAVKKAVEGTGCLVGAVGVITSATQAQGILASGAADLAIVGRAFLKDPNLVWHWAEELGVDVHVPSQYGWGFGMTRSHRKTHH